MNYVKKKYTESLKISLMLIASLVLITSCKNAPFDVPSEFDIVSHNSSNDEILALEYKGEMLITVSENISKKIKGSAMFGPGPMKISFEANFPVLVGKFKGENLSRQSHYFINDNIYLHRSFDYSNSDSDGYYEYGALHIEKPEAYYEFFISGKKSKQIEHREVINKLLKVIR